MYNVQFTGEISELEQGIKQISDALGFVQKDSGITVSVECKDGGLSLYGKDGVYKITFGLKADFFRALALLLGNIGQGKNEIEIHETRKILSCGMMIDCSRNAVLKPSVFEDILRKMACMGLNMAMLYTEDTYEIDDYPYFGYMRGRYTKAELKSMDAYAAALGIELIPCIQTLAHLAAALRWSFANDIKDTGKTLLIDEPETYKFIDAMIKSCRECFSTKRIHLGMDEAEDAGTGKFLEKYGYEKRFDIISRHLFKVAAMAGEYGFEPMIWGDMFYSASSPTWNYLDLNAVIPEDMPEKIPQNISMVFYDYDDTDIDKYRVFIEKFKQMGRKIIFGGANHKWCGMGINYSTLTARVTPPALKACREANIDTVFATMWGDNGGEISNYAALLGFQLYAEHIYYDDVSESHLRERFKQCVGYDMDAFLALEVDDYPEEWRVGVHSTTSKPVLYQDLLLGLHDKNFECVDLAGHYKKKSEAFKNVNPQKGLEKLFDYQAQLLRVLAQKCDMGIRITNAYLNRDTTVMNGLLQELSQLYTDMELLHEKFRVLWLSQNKPFGLECADLRFGGCLVRIKIAKSRISDFLEGKIDKIEELEETRLLFNYGAYKVDEIRPLTYCHAYDRFVVPAVI